MLTLLGYIIFKRLSGILIYRCIQPFKEKKQPRSCSQHKRQKWNQIAPDLIFFFSMFISKFDTLFPLTILFHLLYHNFLLFYGVFYLFYLCIFLYTIQLCFSILLCFLLQTGNK